MPDTIRAATPSIELQPRDLRLLRGLFESRLMTLAHVAALYFNGAAEGARKRIKLLKDARLLAERPRRPYQPSVLHLTRRAFGVLAERGLLADFPALTWKQMENRAQVSELTLRHEIDVMDVKVALTHGFANEGLEISEFLTWPRLFEFRVDISGVDGMREMVIKPDGFARVVKRDADGRWLEQYFFLERDRGTEEHDTLILKVLGYQAYYARDGLAVRYGGMPSRPVRYPFRVLVVMDSEARRNNLATRILQTERPAPSMVYMTTFPQVLADPIGSIWVCPKDYRAVVHGTPFDPQTYRVRGREPARDAFVAGRVNKRRLLS